MAYKTKDLEKQALKAIKDNNLIFIEEIVTFLPCNKQTFYNHKLDELDDLKKALEDNKVKNKQSLREKWYKSFSPALQLAVYKLCATDQERKILSQTFIDHSTKNEKIEGINFIVPNDPGHKT